jgi:hypothetical protein
VAALALMLALTLGGSAISHLRVGAQLDNALHARNLAEAALSRAIERVLHTNGSFGAQPSDQVSLTFPASPAGSQGGLTFDPTAAVFSTYNLKQSNPKVGFLGRSVPPESVHLVAVGRCRGVERRMEAILAVPTFRYSVLNAGSLVSHGSMLVGGVAPDQDPMQAIADEDLLPGHIASNASMELTPASAAKRILVKGDARSTGLIDTGASPTAEIEGAKLENASAMDIPRVVLSQFDPSDLGATHQIQHVGFPVSKAVGLVKQPGDVTVNKLKLGGPSVGAVVWVDGDLTILDGVEGTGVLIATGDISIQGLSSLNGDDQLAILAHGKVRVEGSTPVSSAFQGLIYSGAPVNQAGDPGPGGVELSNVTVVGSVVGNGDQEMSLSNANLIHAEEPIEFQFDIPFKGGNGFAPTALPNVDVDIHIAGTLADYYDANSDAFPSVYSGNPDDPNNTIKKSDLVMDIWENNAFVGSYPLAQLPAQYASAQAEIDSFADLSVEKLSADLAKINDFYQQIKDVDPSEKGKFTLDPNRFLQFSQKTRVALWREI